MYTFNDLKALVRNHASQGIFLIETKSKEGRMQTIAMMLGFTNCEVVEARGLEGGLTLMWNKDLKMNCLWKTEILICYSVKEGIGDKN